MPRYRVLEMSFIGDRLYEPDTVVEFDGIPGEHLMPLCPAGRKAAKLAAQQAAAANDNIDDDREEAAPMDLQ